MIEEQHKLRTIIVNNNMKGIFILSQTTKITYHKGENIMASIGGVLIHFHSIDACDICDGQTALLMGKIKISKVKYEHYEGKFFSIRFSAWLFIAPNDWRLIDDDIGNFVEAIKSIKQEYQAQRKQNKQAKEKV